MPGAIHFLTVDDVLRLHQIAIIDQGGDPSIRDPALLDSAIATPRQQFGGRYLHHDIPAMAAAYAFHICKNHPFVDGNKRAATAAMIAFLSDNGWRFDAPVDEAEAGILLLAAGELEKAAFTDWAKKYMHEMPKLELRDFFAGIRFDQFDEYVPSMLSGGGGSLDEFKSTYSEAAGAIPLLHDVMAKYENTDPNDAVTRAATMNLGYFLLALYRIAEDMGYEW